jgi:cyclic pyranopterin phosphate synthase
MRAMDARKLTHADDTGEARMVDVGSKAVTARRALAVGWVRMAPATLDLVVRGATAKGDALAVARLAGIQGAKRTGELIPLCHPLALDHVDVRTAIETPDRVRIEAEARVSARTGVEMEALTAVAVAALTLYDMIKGVDRGAVIQDVHLVEKDGGKSGAWRRAADEGRTS